MKGKLKFGEINLETFILCIVLVIGLDSLMFYHGATSREKATFINMPPLDKDMTPYERYFKATRHFNGELVHIRLEKSGLDTFAIWPNDVPLVTTGSKIEVSNFFSLDKEYYVKKPKN